MLFWKLFLISFGTFWDLLKLGLGGNVPECMNEVLHRDSKLGLHFMKQGIARDVLL